jgi:hypothetical protein
LYPKAQITQGAVKNEVFSYSALAAGSASFAVLVHCFAGEAKSLRFEAPASAFFPTSRRIVSAIYAASVSLIL